MAGTSLDQVFVMEYWAAMCRSAQSHAMIMAQMCPRVIADMMFEATRKLCDQGPPSSGEELTDRHTQVSAVSSMIACIAHADLMARMHPSVADQIIEETRNFCNRALPGTSDGLMKLHMQSMELSSRIARICHADTMRQ